MSAKKKADRKAFIEDYLKLCSQYGFCIDAADYETPLVVENITNWDMTLFYNYMRRLA